MDKYRQVAVLEELLGRNFPTASWEILIHKKSPALDGKWTLEIKING